MGKTPLGMPISHIWSAWLNSPLLHFWPSFLLCAPWEATGVRPSSCGPAPTREICIKFRAPSFSLVQPWLLGTFGEWTNGHRISLCLCLSQIKWRWEVWQWRMRSSCNSRPNAADTQGQASNVNEGSEPRMSNVEWLGLWWTEAPSFNGKRQLLLSASLRWARRRKGPGWPDFWLLQRYQ